MWILRILKPKKRKKTNISVPTSFTDISYVYNLLFFFLVIRSVIDSKAGLHGNVCSDSKGLKRCRSDLEAVA